MKIVVRLGLLFWTLVVLSGCMVNLNLLRSYEHLGEVEIKQAESFFTSHKILLVDCSGVITGESGDSRFDKPSLLVQILDVLEKARSDTDVKGLILRIDSPGGDVTASDIIHREIRNFKRERAERGVPVVVVASMMDLAASGGYYIAMAADKVYAHPTTVTGSIGVISIFPNIKGLSEKIGFGWKVIKSGTMKDHGSLFRDMTAEEEQVFQELIQDMYDQFINVVAANRSQLTREEILRLADGRVYTARQALKLKLIDDIEYLDNVIDQTRQFAGISDASLVTYRYRGGSKRNNIYARQPYFSPKATAPQINLLNVDGQSLERYAWPRFQYRYIP